MRLTTSSHVFKRSYTRHIWKYCNCICLLIAAIPHTLINLRASEFPEQNVLNMHSSAIHVNSNTCVQLINAHENTNVTTHSTTTDENMSDFAFLVQCLLTFEQQYHPLIKKFCIIAVSDALACLYGLQLITAAFSQQQNASILHNFWHALRAYAKNNLTEGDEDAATQWRVNASNNSDRLTRIVYQLLEDERIDIIRVQCAIANIIQDKLTNLHRPFTHATAEALEKIKQMQLHDLSEISKNLAKRKELSQTDINTTNADIQNSIHPSYDVMKNIGTITCAWDTLHAFYTKELIDKKEAVILAWYLFYLARWLQSLKNPTETNVFETKLSNLFSAITNPEITVWEVNRKIGKENKSKQIDVQNMRYARLLHLLSLLLIQELCIERSGYEIQILKKMLKKLSNALESIQEQDIITGTERIRVRFILDVVNLLHTNSAHQEYNIFRKKNHRENLVSQVGAHDIRKYCYCALRVGLRYQSTLQEGLPNNCSITTMLEHSSAHASHTSQERLSTINATAHRMAQAPMLMRASAPGHLQTNHVSSRAIRGADTANATPTEMISPITTNTIIDPNQAIYSSSSARFLLTHSIAAEFHRYNNYSFTPQNIAIPISKIPYHVLPIFRNSATSVQQEKNIERQRQKKTLALALSSDHIEKRPHQKHNSSLSQDKEKGRQSSCGVLCTSSELSREHSYYEHESKYEHNEVWYWWLFFVVLCFTMVCCRIATYDIETRYYNIEKLSYHRKRYIL